MQNERTKLESKDSKFEKELRLCRNEIYARKGYDFKSVELKEYFKKFEWYKPNIEFNFENISIEEKRSIASIRNLEKLVKNNEISDTVYLNRILNEVRKNYNRRIDTTIYTYFDFSGDQQKDTLKTHVIEAEGVIQIYYSYFLDNIEYSLESYYKPYFFKNNLSESLYNDIFYQKITALEKCLPDSLKADEMLKENLEFIIDIGVNELTKLGCNISKKDYQRYVLNHKGQLLYYHQDETGGKIKMWYSRINKFITFYKD